MEHWLKMVQLHMKNILGKIDKMTILHNARNASQINKHQNYLIFDLPFIFFLQLLFLQMFCFSTE